MWIKEFGGVDQRLLTVELRLTSKGIGGHSDISGVGRRGALGVRWGDTCSNEEGYSLYLSVKAETPMPLSLH